LPVPPVFFEINLFFDSSKEIQQKHQASSRFGEGKEDKESTKKHPRAPTLLLTTRELL
jgi:hypothetical protein